MVEYWDLFDENRNPLGIQHIRGQQIPQGMYHLVVHSWLMDNEGRFLISQRQKGRTDELLWERTGGSVLSGETSLQGAIREVREELGINVQYCNHYFIKSVKREERHDFFDAWLFIVPNNTIPYIIEKDEVRAWKWATIEEMEYLKDKKMLVDTSEYFDEIYYIYKQII